MRKLNWLLYGTIVVCIIIGLFSFRKITKDTYDGMSIIPEQHKDIPLFEGLEPNEHQYIVDGNQWIDIYKFYKVELPKFGWKLKYIDTALNVQVPENDGGGFYSHWRKEGFDGELWISAGFNSLEDQTVVIFDKTPIYNSSIWIHHVPENICIYENLLDENCTEMKE
ncbi:hypothetical protein JOC86_000195 [Bacillus pakistanensis]|uniref:Uncharacterized protein n=1 Tax=Rossellomorea pakistanensis TaxID=992288 RepID=A0ABS2N735_9BACI|nr:hypothetical protein [Bacillus pakistanensis]MBM7583658.1 hypothetical protein [Bacillus pakistanensis]